MMRVASLEASNEVGIKITNQAECGGEYRRRITGA